jgi:hypothetical protein
MPAVIEGMTTNGEGQTIDVLPLRACFFRGEKFGKFDSYSG